MARPGKLDDEQVAQIRMIYASAREYSDEVGPDDEGYQTITETEERLATTFGVSQPMIRRIVLGLSYASVGGPLDERRRAVAKEVLDETPPTAVRVTVTRPGGQPKVYVHPPGTTIFAEPIVADPTAYAESGLPLKGNRVPPAASPPMKRATSSAPTAAPAQVGDAAKREKDEIARLRERLADPLTPEWRRPGLERKLEKLLYRGDVDSTSSGSGNI